LFFTQIAIILDLFTRSYYLKICRSFSSCNSIKTFDFSTLYTTIPYSNPWQTKEISSTLFH